MLPKEECEQLSIQDNHDEENERPAETQLKPEDGEQQEIAAQPHQCNAERLSPFGVQVIGSPLALQNEA
jgi:hypothetical protein